MWVGCEVCLSPNAEEKLQAASPLGLCPSQKLSGKSQTVLSMSATVQEGRLAWAKEAAFELKLLVCACMWNCVPPWTEAMKGIQSNVMEKMVKGVTT